MKGALVSAMLLAALSVPARASPECMTMQEARAAFPGKHLWWHYADDRRIRCWDDNGPIHRSAVEHRPRAPALRPVPVPRATVLWPTLASVVTPVDAALLLTPEPATRWPLLLDVDELTAAPVAELPECCWPPLEPAFTERWYALPSSWFLAAIGERLQ